MCWGGKKFNLSGDTAQYKLQILPKKKNILQSSIILCASHKSAFMVSGMCGYVIIHYMNTSDFKNKMKFKS
jgi:hypothetical protein